MRIDISKLSEDREFFLSEVWDPKGHEMDSFGIEYQGSLKLDVKASRQASVVNIYVKLESDRSLVCHRCYENFIKPLDREFKLVYALEAGLKYIEIDDDIRDEILLDDPVKVLCKEDCRGLCVKCGANLNNEKCKCK